MKQSCPTSTMWRHLFHYLLIKKSGFAQEQLRTKGRQVTKILFWNVLVAGKREKGGRVSKTWKRGGH